MDERKNVLGMSIDEGGAEITIEDGHIYFSDSSATVEISEDVDTVYYDEYRGYVLPDGRNINDIVIG